MFIQAVQLRVSQDDNGGEDTVKGDTVISVDTNYIFVLQSDAAAYFMRVNGDQQTLTVLLGANSGDWFGDSSSRDNFSVGAKVDSTAQYFFDGRIAEVVVYDKFLSDSSVRILEKYFSNKYGITLA
jgi:hypothetical protein